MRGDRNALDSDRTFWAIAGSSLTGGFCPLARRVRCGLEDVAGRAFEAHGQAFT
jgi:hypothetical protein